MDLRKLLVLLPMWIFFLLGTIFGAWAKNTWHIMAHRGTMAPHINADQNRSNGPTLKNLKLESMLQMLPAGPLQKLQDLRPSRLGQLLCKARASARRFC